MAPVDSVAPRTGPVALADPAADVALTDPMDRLLLCEFFTAGGRLAPADGEPPAAVDAGPTVHAPRGEGSIPQPSGRPPSVQPPAGPDADRPGPDPELLAEGRAMRDSLLRDLARLPELELSFLVAPGAARGRTEGRPAPPPAGEPLPGGREPAAALSRHLEARPGAGVWIIAPETGGTLATLRSAARAAGGRLVGTPPDGVRRAAHRADLLRRLAGAGVTVPATRTASGPEEARRAADALGLPVVVKPGRGAGAAGTTRIEEAEELAAAWHRAAAVEPGLPPLVQRHVSGVPVSVLLLAASGDARPLSLSRQHVRFTPEARYLGGETPWPVPDPAPVLAAARRACRVCGGLRGLVGVDLVLGPGGPVVLEINPRLTTSYLGLRAHRGAAAARAALELAGRGRRARRPAGPGWNQGLRPVVRGEPVRFATSGEGRPAAGELAAPADRNGARLAPPDGSTGAGRTEPP